MRIAVVHSFYQKNFPSGENLAVLAQVEALKGAGHTVRLIAQSSDDFLTATLSYRLGSAWRVVSGRGASPETEIAEFRPDVVHIHNLFPNWGYRWVKEIQAPVVWSIHNFRPLCAAGTLYRNGAPCRLCPTQTSLHSLVNKCYRGSIAATVPLAISTARAFPSQYVPRHVDRVIFLSEHQRRTYEDLNGLVSNAAVVPNFVPDVETINQAGGKPTGWCYIGRISEEKGVFDLLRSWPVGTPLTFYGDGPGVSQLTSMLTKDMAFVGQVPNDQVHRILLGHQGLVFSSKVTEIAPLTYMESLRAGRPVIAFVANAAARDIVSNGGRGGEVFDDWKDVARFLRSLDNNLGARQEARAIYEEKFSLGAWLLAIETLYWSVVQPQKR